MAPPTDTPTAYPPSKPFLQPCNALITSLVNNRDNLHALSEALYPPVNDNPEFMTVNYNFTDVYNSEETWYWSAVISHFIHPYEVFQYLSLFFAKPRKFYVGDVQIKFIGTDPLVTECANDNHVMQLVTQRVSQEFNNYNNLSDR